MRPLWVFPTSPITRTSTCLHPFSGPRGGLLNKLQIPLQLAAAYGPPTFFVTFTCNADWPEIQSQLRPGQDFTDVPIVVVRVFRQKLSTLESTLKSMFPNAGRLLYIIHSIEFQKRGLPHAHILLKFEQDCVHPCDIDAIVNAEMPSDPDDAQ